MREIFGREVSGIRLPTPSTSANMPVRHDDDPCVSIGRNIRCVNYRLAIKKVVNK
jgi:hypothetical protein